MSKRSNSKFDKNTINALFGGVNQSIKKDTSNESKLKKQKQAEANDKRKAQLQKANQHKNQQVKHQDSKASSAKSNQVKKPNTHKSTKSKSKKSAKSKFDNEFSSVRLTVRSIARLNAYQKVSGLKNRSEALNSILDKALPLLLNNTQKTSAKVIEKLFESSHKGNAK